GGAAARRLCSTFGSSGLPPFCASALCFSAKGTGGGGGAILATTGRVTTAAGGAGGRAAVATVALVTPGFALGPVPPVTLAFTGATGAARTMEAAAMALGETLTAACATGCAL